VRRATLCALLLLLVPPGASAQTLSETTNQRLERIEREIDAGRHRKQDLEKEASRLGRDLRSMKRGLVGAAAAVQRQEAVISSLEQRLGALKAQEGAKVADLAARRSTLGEMLGTLVRLRRQPPEALIASPMTPNDTVRLSVVLAALIPDIERRAAALRTELEALRRLRREMAGKRARLSHATGGLGKERRALDRLLHRVAKRHRRTVDETRRQSRRLADMAARAQDLRALVRRLEAEEKKQGSGATPFPALRFSQVEGRLPLPARGRLVGHFGEKEAVGTVKGVTIATLPFAQVVAPHDGKVVYSGPFRSYGQLLIISHGEGYHTLIAGMSRIDSVVGQWLLAGEPVGRMGRRDGGKTNLYVELRRNGEPINPLPWLAASERKVSG
jgi:septal ring factor EnvC (AmiA/AmiB activator)|tara:strand:+ start:2061 stop:3221 length:1161 start_codon:yes stop_codon:yes gene_type:complete